MASKVHGNDGLTGVAFPYIAKVFRLYSFQDTKDNRHAYDSQGNRALDQGAIA
jgi:hypothetical protein